MLREEDGILEAQVDMEADGREELSLALVQAGLGLRRIDRTNLGLESIFLQLTGDRAGEQG